MTQSYSPVAFTEIAVGAAANADTFNTPLFQILNGLLGSNDLAPRQLVVSLVTGESITLGNLVRLSAGLVYKADNGSVAGVTNIIGVALETKSSNNIIKVAVMTVVGFTGLTIGAIQYAGASGAITETPPSSNQMPIGIATSTTSILLMKPKPGEIIEVTKTTSTAGSTTLGTYTDAGHSTFTLTPGVWTIFATATISISGATGTGVAGVVSVLS